MRKITTFILFMIGFAAVASDPIIISVSSIKEDRQVANFSGIASSGYVNVIIRLGDKESCRLEGDADAIADLITEVKGSTLNIRPKTKVYTDNKFRNAKVTAYITAKKITSLTMSGSAEMRVESPITTNSLTTTLSGSGSIKLTASLQSYTGVISGSGRITLTGSTEQANITVSGSGNFAGRDFSIDDLSTQVSGSGGVSAKVSDNLSAVISGSGNVNYNGNPRVTKTTVGSGRVIKA